MFLRFLVCLIVPVYTASPILDYYHDENEHPPGVLAENSLKQEENGLLNDSVKKEKVYRRVDVKAKYNGNLSRFIGRNLELPDEAIKNGVEGVVSVQFIVKADGTLANFIVQRGIGYGCQEEAIRVLNLTSGDWTPAMVKGQPVNSYHLVPIRFQVPPPPKVINTRSGRGGSSR